MRQVVNFNSKWAFTKMADAPPTTMPALWDYVNIPHTWNAIDGTDGGNDYYRGTCYYAKQLCKSDLPVADKYYLEFQGTNSIATVYVNSAELATHQGGYSTWRVDITDSLQQDNLIVVKVDNSKNDFTYPQMADFTFYGGIYRDVNIICVSHTHFQLDYFGGPGAMVTPEIIGDSAIVKVQAFVANAKNQQLNITIKNMQGDSVVGVSVPCTKPSATLQIQNVNLWQGVDNPYLYTACLELVDGGQVTDNISIKFGCRQFKIDANDGFILNGKPYPLRGVSRHQDRLGVGNALTEDMHLEDMRLIAEMGANTIRLAHYQHSQYFYDLCDEYGMVVWAEIPYISSHLPNANQNAVNQMKELVIQNYNHPSIVVWGISNEITMNEDSQNADQLLDTHKMLNDLCHSLDKTRLTTVAAVSMCSIDNPYLQIPDVVSYNHYFGWYGGDVSMNGPWFDNFHKAYPATPIGCSEYGCEALNWHASQIMQGDYTEEYQAYYHQEMIKQLFSRKYLWSTYVWNMFDFGADARNEGGENGQNHKGLVTFDRKYKKDAFYAYKAWLSKEPFVHICSKRYVNRVENIATVTVYSNLPTVELFANGMLVDKQTNPQHFFTFKVQNLGTTHLKAVAGTYTDQSVIKKVDSFDDSYRLKEKGAVLNWFDVTTVDGCFSLNDKVGDILAHQQGAKLFYDFMSFASKGDSVEAAGFTLGESAMQMMSGFTLLRLTSMMSMMNVEFTKDQLLDLNKKLNSIKKNFP